MNFELINGVWDSKDCRECCGECCRGSCGVDCPLDFEGTCDNCIFKNGFKKEFK